MNLRNIVFYGLLCAMGLSGGYARGAETPLRDASRDGDVEEVKRLLNKGADVDDRNGWIGP